MESNINFPVRTYWIKVSIVFLACMLFLSLQSCEEEKTPEEILIGTWNIESERTIKYHIWPDDAGETIEDDSTYNYGPNEGAIQFLEGGIGKVYKNGAIENPHIWSWEPHFCTGDTFSCVIGKDTLKITSKECSGQIYVSFTVGENDLTLKFISYDGLFCTDFNPFLLMICWHLREEKILILSR